MRSSVCTKSSSDGSRRRRCCHQLRQPRCCFGRCSLPARSTCERLTVGERLPKHPSVSQLTSRPDSVLSKCRRSRHPIPTQIATAPQGGASQSCILGSLAGSFCSSTNNRLKSTFVG